MTMDVCGGAQINPGPEVMCMNKMGILEDTDKPWFGNLLRSKKRVDCQKKETEWEVQLYTSERTWICQTKEWPTKTSPDPNIP